MIKLSSLTAKNFKSLVDTKVDFFGDTNFFYGYNNSGKSNVFKLLKLIFEKKKAGTNVKYELDEETKKTTDSKLPSIVNFKSGYIWNEPFLFTKNIRTTPIIFTVELDVDNSLFPEVAILKKNKFLDKKITKVKFEGQITSEGTETSYLEITKGFLNKKQFYRTEDRIDYFFEKGTIDKSIGEDIFILFDDLVLLIDSDRNFVKESSQDVVSSMEAKTFKNSLFDLYIKAEKNEGFNKLTQFLSDFEFSDEAKAQLKSNINSFPFNNGTDIGFARFDDEIEVMLKNISGKLPLKNFGTGIQQFLYLLAKIHFNKSKVVIIEELELNLSPLYQKELLRFLKSLQKKLYNQLLFSSHSPYFAQKEIKMIDAIHHVQIDYTMAGGTCVESHDDIDLFDMAAENGFFYFT